MEDDRGMLGHTDATPPILAHWQKVRQYEQYGEDGRIPKSLVPSVLDCPTAWAVLLPRQGSSPSVGQPVLSVSQHGRLAHTGTQWSHAHPAGLTGPAAADRMVAGAESRTWPRAGLRPGPRKVRAPQGRAMGNAHRPRGQGQRNRKHTAHRPVGTWERERVGE